MKTENENSPDDLFWDFGFTFFSVTLAGTSSFSVSFLVGTLLDLLLVGTGSFSVSFLVGTLLDLPFLDFLKEIKIKNKDSFSKY